MTVWVGAWVGVRCLLVRSVVVVVRFGGWRDV